MIWNLMEYSWIKYTMYNERLSLSVIISLSCILQPLSVLASIRPVGIIENEFRAKLIIVTHVLYIVYPWLVIYLRNIGSKNVTRAELQ